MAGCARGEEAIVLQALSLALHGFLQNQTPTFQICYNYQSRESELLFQPKHTYTTWRTCIVHDFSRQALKMNHFIAPFLYPVNAVFSAHDQARNPNLVHWNSFNDNDIINEFGLVFI